MPRGDLTRVLAIAAGLALALFAALTAVVVLAPSVPLDARAFIVLDDLRSPGLDHAARVVTTLGLFAVVGPSVLVGALVLVRSGHPERAAALVGGALLTWAGVWVIKGIVGRPRPSAPITPTAGPSYPSAHAGNSMGWLALAVALAVLVGARGARVAVIAAGALLAATVGASRVYLRAHYASDVIGGELFAVAAYCGVALGVVRWGGRRRVAD